MRYAQDVAPFGWAEGGHVFEHQDAADGDGRLPSEDLALQRRADAPRRILQREECIAVPTHLDRFHKTHQL
eukprot:CAMPEP_0197485880 /NCGR_PEP_ID=MMETSP1311-20131121/787_1 /TAXON_ID=464262 /ORGANISM="Genus nov. species nov., Strain RCC856" /LENGTH=70 /DNA_ID=CAMNT_0043028665 /DNA_START=50 /DNA_END=262 /DNA_ORIENTATION=+